MEPIVVFTIIAFLAGFFCGFAVSCIKSSRKEPVGDLRIDTSDPDDNPYLFLELSKDLNFVRRKKYITLKVNTISYIPHK